MANKNNDVVIKDVYDKGLEAKIKKLKECQIIMEQAKKEVEDLKAEVKGYMNDINEKYIAVGPYKCKISETITTKFDKEYVKKHAPKTYENAIYTETGTRFTIT